MEVELAEEDGAAIVGLGEVDAAKLGNACGAACVERIGAFLDLELTPQAPITSIQPRRQEILAVTRRCYAKRAAALAPYLARFDYPVFPAEDSP